MSTTLIVVAMLAQSPAIMHSTYSSDAACIKVLRVSAEGLVNTFNGNVTGPSKLGKYEVSMGKWTVLESPVGRVIAQLRCVSLEN